MKNSELKEIYGGAFSFTTTFFNSIARYITTIKGIGESIGSSIKRLIKRRYC